MADVKDKMKNGFSKMRTSFQNQMDGLASHGKSLVLTVILTFLVMIVVCLAVFFASVQGAEKVMVPNVVGKNLTTALLEMQQKELYPKIQLRYSESADDAGMILEQNPDAGAIVKAYRRVTLTVSRGPALDTIEDFSGQNIEDVKKRLQNLYAGETPLVELATPVYRQDSSAKGKILAQYPEAGTHVIDKVKLHLVVSNGDSAELVSVPELEGKSIAQVLKLMETSKLIFDFDVNPNSEGVKKATVLSQGTAAKTEVESYSRIGAELSLPHKTADSKTVFGVFTCNLPNYPYALPTELTSLGPDGQVTTLVSMKHIGGKVTIPYEVEKGTTLTLSVKDEVMARQTVN